LIETIFELLSPFLRTREIYMNISYLKPSMIDYMDSPVPFFIGMSDLLWNLEDGGGA
jgi:hypothetical protein